MEDTKKVINEIFGIKEAPKTLERMSIVFNGSGVNHTMEQVFRDADGSIT